MAITEVHRISPLILLILCFNLLTVLVGADFKWYDKVFELDDSDWIELRSSNFTSFEVKSEILSTVYLSFSRRNLTFEFPFYGEKISTVLVTTQGFISMIGEPYPSPYMTETLYVSPLMANFAPRETDPTQDIRIHQDDDMFIVQWSTMLLAEEESSDGYFTFQTQLHKDGTIKFIYKEVPISVADIVDETHPVVAGLSGGYRYTRPEADGEYKLHPDTPVYEAFDTINLSESKIASGTTYTFIPQPSCLQENSCSKCRARSDHCHWCPTIQRCSTGRDSLKPQWDASCRILSKSACEDEVVNITVTDPAARAPLTDPSQLSNKPGSMTTEKTADITDTHHLPTIRDQEKQNTNNTDMVVIKALLISTCTIVLLLIVATVLVRRYGWRSTIFMSHVKLENKGCHCNEEVNHTLIKVEDSST